ncbi:hypothetical protein, partial [Coleofasciculus sp. FACHB-129]|uniref:hypothetical protein n=1 Tax=Cyanophyceae TaxID=3028117 RepID=UPI001A7E534F
FCSTGVAFHAQKGSNTSHDHASFYPTASSKQYNSRWSIIPNGVVTPSVIPVLLRFFSLRL